MKNIRSVLMVICMLGRCKSTKIMINTEQIVFDPLTKICIEKEPGVFCQHTLPEIEDSH